MGQPGQDPSDVNLGGLAFLLLVGAVVVAIIAIVLIAPLVADEEPAPSPSVTSTT